MPMAGMKPPRRPRQGAGRRGLVGWYPSCRLEREHCRSRHASRPSVFGLTLDRESIEREVEHRDKSNRRLCPVSGLEVTTACLNMQNQSPPGSPTRGRGDAVSKVSRQTSYGEMETLSNQGSLEASLGIISRRMLQKQCSSMCLRPPAVSPDMGTWVVSPGIESHMPFLRIKSKTDMDWDTCARHERACMYC